ncbi:peptidoglycan-associated lipoprotein Pal [bacterium]|nr:peptidoglycan-associated lipoprotein Pal [bacterium]
MKFNRNFFLSILLIAALTALAGCQSKPKGKAVKSDIPLTTIPSGTFVDPPDEFKFVFQPILFDFDRSSIRTDMKQSLSQVAQWMSVHSKVLLRLEGHCDERGTEEYNLALGERRALAVRELLVAKGVTAERLTTISYGEERPANSEHNEFAWAENRRVEFKLAQ